MNPTDSAFPPILESAIRGAAARLGRALRMLEYPNKGTDSPCHEVNAVINISVELSRADPPFQLYAEGTTVNRGRVDLIGFNGKIAFALEAKGFGRINFKAEEVFNDWKRLEGFEPMLSEVAGNELAEQWWSQAESRWRIIVISSFRGKELADAWSCVEEQAFREAMKSYRRADGPREVDGEPVGILKLHSAIAGVPHGAFSIGEGSRWGGADGWLLWAAARI